MGGHDGNFAPPSAAAPSAAATLVGDTEARDSFRCLPITSASTVVLAFSPTSVRFDVSATSDPSPPVCLFPPRGKPTPQNLKDSPDRRAKVKTEMCRHYLQGGAGGCPYGHKCEFWSEGVPGCFAWPTLDDGDSLLIARNRRHDRRAAFLASIDSPFNRPAPWPLGDPSLGSLLSKNDRTTGTASAS